MVSFVYPYGAFDGPTEELVSQTYQIAVKTGGGTLLRGSERYRLSRLSVKLRAFQLTN